MKQKNTKKNIIQMDEVVRFSISMKSETEKSLLEICEQENRNKSQMISTMILAWKAKQVNP